MGQKNIHAKLEVSIMRLYCVSKQVIEFYAAMSWRLVNSNVFGLWHDCLVHWGATMMRKIIENNKGHPLKNTKVLLFKDYSRESYF